MPVFVLTARNYIPLSNGQTIERGRQIEVYVNGTGTMASNIFVTRDGKEAVTRAFGLQGIPPTPNFMNSGKWEVKPIMPKY